MRKHIIIILCMGLYLFFIGNNSIYITDPVESNYALTAKEMLQSGDLISPRIYGQYWYDKPVFFYWELIAAFKLWGINEFAARFFPALFGVLGLLMTYLFASRIYDKKTGLFASLILGTSLEYWILSKLIITDMTLFVFFNAVLVFFYLAYQSTRKWLYYFCYFFAGTAVLTKGPIGFLLPGLIVTLFFLWRRRWSELKQMKIFSGFIIFLITAGSWYYPMYALHGNDFLNTFLGVHNFLRATVSEHPQYDVWYYYTVMFLIGFFPWIFVVPMLIRRYWKAKHLPKIDETKGFLLIWAVTIAFFYQCMATKYSTYSFPYLLPIAILTARFLLDHSALVKRLSIAFVILYTGLTFFAAIPFCKLYSAKEPALKLSQSGAAKDLVISIGDYRTSAVFYGDMTIYRLEKQENIDKMEPNGMNWNSKNVMPFYAEEQLAAEPRDVWAIVSVNREAAFKQSVDASWKRVKSYEKVSIFHQEKSNNNP